MNKVLSYVVIGFLAAAGTVTLLSSRAVDDGAWASKMNLLQDDLGEFTLVEKEGMIVLISNSGGRYRIIRARDGWVELGRKDISSDTYWAPAGRVIIKRR